MASLPPLALAVLGAAQLGAAPGAADDPARLLGMALLGEPTIDEVQRAAATRAAPPREESDGWRRRARLAPLLPRVEAQYRHDDRSLRVSGLTSTSEVDYLREAPGDTVQVRLTWNLADLVFARSELEASAAAQRAEARRQAAIERATRLYFERLRLRLELLTAPPAGVARARMELDLEVLTAQLRALTGIGEEASR